MTNKVTLNSVLSVLIASAIVLVGTMFLVYTMAATDEGVDLSGTEYEAQHNSTTDLAILTITITQFIPMVLGVIGLILAVWLLKKRSKS